MQLKVKRGDTIIETMFAFAVFGLIAITTIQIMQQGTRINQTALEVSLAREQLTAQAEALRLANTAYINEYIRTKGNVPTDSLWAKITSRLVGSVANLGSYVGSDGRCRDIPGLAFVLDPMSQSSGAYRTYNMLKAEIYPRLLYDGKDNITIDQTGSLTRSEGIWIEAKAGPGVQPKFYDFMVRACWQSTSSSRASTLETLVRLYVP